MRSANHPQITRCNHRLAASEFGAISPDPDGDAAADDPTAGTRAHVELFHRHPVGAP